MPVQGFICHLIQPSHHLRPEDGKWLFQGHPTGAGCVDPDARSSALCTPTCCFVSTPGFLNFSTDTSLLWEGYPMHCRSFAGSLARCCEPTSNARPNVTTWILSRQCQMSPEGQTRPPVENHYSTHIFILKILQRIVFTCVSFTPLSCLALSFYKKE